MFDFRLSTEQEQIVASLADVLSRHRESLASGGADRIGVADLARLGWIGVGLPEEVGGAGGTVVEETLVARELGRALAPPDVLFLQMAAHGAYAAGEPELASSFVEARSTAGSIVWSGLPQPSAARRDAYLLQTEERTHFWSLEGGDLTLFQLAPGARREALRSMDPEVTLARVDGESLRACCTHRDADGSMLRRAHLLMAGMLSGIADATRDLAVAYAKERRQFGRLIGSFQAIKHRCADMHLRARAAGAQTMLAAMMEAARMPGRAEQVQAALIVSVDAAVRNSEACIQVHGGIGFSEECIAHRYLKRAHLLRIQSGDGVRLRVELAGALGRRLSEAHGGGS